MSHRLHRSHVSHVSNKNLNFVIGSFTIHNKKLNSTIDTTNNTNIKSEIINEFSDDSFISVNTNQAHAP